MELPRRAKDDVFLPDGQFGRVTADLRRQTHCHDIGILIAYAFDFRTRLLPYFMADKRMPPLGPRAIAATLTNAGFKRVRIVLQQWTPNFRPSRARMDGRPPDILMVSAMQIHSEPAYKMIADAWTLGEHRPLIFAGGPKAIYEPAHFLGIGPGAAIHADVAVTGEEYVLLELMQLICSHRGSHETMRAAFERVRGERLLDAIPGLAYRAPDCSLAQPVAISTGVQRLVRDLDELPMPHTALRLMEPKHRGEGLTGRSLPDSWFGKRPRHIILSVATTHGCKFNCGFCPIPAFNQRTWRFKSPQRVVDEFREAAETFGIRYFFGTDDNFFSRRETAQGIFEAAARARVAGRKFRDKVRFLTEATEADVYRNRDLLPLASRAGLRGIWFGIEDLQTGMINKGQSAEKTRLLFTELRKYGIEANVMMIHHDDQPRSTPGALGGVLDQARFVYEAGAVSYQCTYLGSLVGARIFEDAIRRGTHIYKVAGKVVPEAYWDGNHVTATARNDAWKRQLNLLSAYGTFYNPVHLIRGFREYAVDRVGRKRLGAQVWGTYGVVMTAIKTARWIWRLKRGPVEKLAVWPRHPVRLVDSKTGEEVSWAVDTKVMAAASPLVSIGFGSSRGAKPSEATPHLEPHGVPGAEVVTVGGTPSRRTAEAVVG
jgi:radical SAM superfamily enzyme YgiQ (UPF0313 family)